MYGSHINNRKSRVHLFRNLSMQMRNASGNNSIMMDSNFFASTYISLRIRTNPAQKKKKKQKNILKLSIHFISILD